MLKGLILMVLILSATTAVWAGKEAETRYINLMDLSIEELMNIEVTSVAKKPQRLSDAAKVISINPMAMQLRFLQTLSEVASENNSTTIFPIPIDLFKPFMETYIENK